MSKAKAKQILLVAAVSLGAMWLANNVAPVGNLVKKR